MIKFSLKLDTDIDYKINFKIFDTKKLMYKYFDKYYSNAKRNFKDAHNFVGLCCPEEVIDFKGSKETKRGYSNILLTYEKINVGILVHEVSHAITSFLRMKYNVCNFGNDIGKREEEFAWHLGWVMNKLNDFSQFNLSIRLP